MPDDPSLNPADLDGFDLPQPFFASSFTTHSMSAPQEHRNYDHPDAAAIRPRFFHSHEDDGSGNRAAPFWIGEETARNSLKRRR